MKSPNEIIEELITTGFVEKYVRKRFIGSPYQEDVIQDIYEMLLIWPRLQEIYKSKGINGVRAIASGMVQRHLSVKGAGYRKYVRELTWCNEEYINNNDLFYEQKNPTI